MGYQYTVIIGNLTADPELKYSQSGVAICSFGVAVNRKWTDRNTSERREEVTYFRVTAWRGLAETANEYLSKGRQVMIAGRVSASAYIANDGEARASLEITAQDVQFLGRAGERESAGPNDRRHPVTGKPAEREDMPF
jgi:single-strand DNA-binding protein